MSLLKLNISNRIQETWIPWNNLPPIPLRNNNNISNNVEIAPIWTDLQQRGYYYLARNRETSQRRDVGGRTIWIPNLMGPRFIRNGYGRFQGANWAKDVAIFSQYGEKSSGKALRTIFVAVSEPNPRVNDWWLIKCIHSQSVGNFVYDVQRIGALVIVGGSIQIVASIEIDAFFGSPAILRIETNSVGRPPLYRPSLLCFSKPALWFNTHFKGGYCPI